MKYLLVHYYYYYYYYNVSFLNEKKVKWLTQGHVHHVYEVCQLTVNWDAASRL